MRGVTQTRVYVVDEPFLMFPESYTLKNIYGETGTSCWKLHVLANDKEEQGKCCNITEGSLLASEKQVNKRICSL